MHALRIVLGCLLISAAAHLVLAAGPEQTNPEQAPCAHCGGQIVYHDVISHRCKLVPDKKQIKKTVYEVKEVPFCLHKLPPLCSLHHGDCCNECGECAECDCPRYKKVLLKKEIVCEEICTTKCVVEEFVERVPCRVCCPDCPNYGKQPAAVLSPNPASQPVLTGQPIAPPLADQELIHIPLPVVTR